MASDGQHILLVDDDIDMHDVVRLILEPCGYRVTCCTTVPCGEQVLQDDPPRLLLLDVMLSTPTEGFEFAARLRSNGVFRTLPIVLISSMPQDTGFEEPGMTGAGRRAATAFIEKPLSPQRLCDTIAGLLRTG
jgi:CheY-like chemotaxis protein